MGKLGKIIKKRLSNLTELFRIKYIRPFNKRKRRKAYFDRRKLVQEATGELIEKFEPLLMVMFDETVSDYRNAVDQNFYTIQAGHDLRKMYEVKVKSYIVSKK